MPPAILHSERVDGFRHPLWIAYPVDEEARPCVAAALVEIEARLQPPRREWIIAILSRLAIGSYPEVTKDAQAFGVRLSDMADDLTEYSEAHIVAACVEWRRSEQWFPKTSELLEKLSRIRHQELVYRHRAQVLLGHKPAAFYELPRPQESPDTKVHDIGPVLEALARAKREGTGATPRTDDASADLAEARAGAVAGRSRLTPEQREILDRRKTNGASQ